MPDAAENRKRFRVTMSGDDPGVLRERRAFRRIPAGPRCKNCNAPFGFPGSVLSRAIGRTRWSKSPRFCTKCYTFLKESGIDGRGCPTGRSDVDALPN